MRRVMGIALGGALSFVAAAALYAQEASQDGPSPATQPGDETGVDSNAVEKRAAALKAEAEQLISEAKARLEGSGAPAETQSIVDQSRAAIGTADLSGIKGIDPGTRKQFADVIAGQNSAETSVQTNQSSHPGLMAFVSLSMPKEALRQTIIDMGKAGGIVVFRGFPGNSMAAFKAQFADVLGSDLKPHNVGIDPRMFEAFKVGAVPTFVAVPDRFTLCGGLDCQSVVPDYDVIRGNIPVSYALETFAQGSGPGAKLAQVGLAQLEAQQ